MDYMDKETFLDAIRQQYVDDIHEAYLECDHGGDHMIDMATLNKKLRTLMANAKVDGLSAAEFEELAKATLPDVAGKIDLAPARKAA
jgi:hypothetical protein